MRLAGRVPAVAVVVQLLSLQLLWPHGLQSTRLPCPSLCPGVCSDSPPLSWWCHPTISSHPLSFPSPPALNFSQHQGLSQLVSSLHQLAKVLKLQLQHQSFQSIFRVDFLQPLTIQLVLSLLWWGREKGGGIWKHGLGRSLVFLAGGHPPCGPDRQRATYWLLEL